MLFPEKMVRVKIEIEPQFSDSVLEAIGKKGVLHVDSMHHLQKNELEASRVKTLLALVQKQMAVLEIKQKKQTMAAVLNVEHLLDQVENTLMGISEKVDDVTSRLKEAEREAESFKRAIAVKEALDPLFDAEVLAEELNSVKMRVAVVTMEAAELLRLAMKQKKLLQLETPLFAQTSAVAIFYEAEDEAEVLKAFGTFKAVEILPRYFSHQAFESHQLAYSMLDQTKKEVAETYRERLQNIESSLDDLRALEEAKSALWDENGVMILEGWIPQKAVEKFALEHAVVTYTECDGEAPVLLDTPPALQPFEKLIRSFSCPRYGEVNPVVPFAFSFLLLFGIMFGDVGHGLILALLGLSVKRYSAHFSDLGQVYYLSGLSSTFFGFMYGSVFGVHDLLPHLMFTPIENVEATIIFSLSIGIAIISFSFFLHMITALKRKEPTLLFMSEGSVLWLLVYWFTIGIAVKSLVQQLSIFYEVIILGILLLIIFIQMLRHTREKSQAVIDLLREFMDTITNTLSFLRVGAFALAHGALFMAVFSIARIISEVHGESFGYWISIIIGNIVIIVLEGVVVTIQTLRLEYYEFFKRFFKGGGTEYHPYTLGEKNEE